MHPHNNDPAFLEGCRTMAELAITMGTESLLAIANDSSYDQLRVLLERVQEQKDLSQRRVAIELISRSNLDVATARWMVFGYALNNLGYAINSDGCTIEDDDFHARLPSRPDSYHRWRHMLARHIETGQEIAIQEFAALNHQDQQHYQTLRYLDLIDDQGQVLRRVTENHTAYMTELALYDLNNHHSDTVRRYLCACGSGITDTFAPGQFYNIRHDVIRALNSRIGYGDSVSSMVLAHVEKGYINTPGQLHLSWLQALHCHLSADNLRDLPGPYVRLLEHLLLAEPEELADRITDCDIIHYRSLGGSGLPGLRHTIISDPEEGEIWERLLPSDPTCEVDLQRDFLIRSLIPNACTAFVNAFKNLDEDFESFDVTTTHALIHLMSILCPDYFDDQQGTDLDAAEAGDHDGCASNHENSSACSGHCGKCHGHDGSGCNHGNHNCNHREQTDHHPAAIVVITPAKPHWTAKKHKPCPRKKQH